MLTSTEDKIKVMWAFLQEMKSEISYDRHAYHYDEMLKKIQSYETTFFNVLGEYGIDYEIDTSVDVDNFYFTYPGTIGMQGFTDSTGKIFTDVDLLTDFLFSDKSVFTFGYENNWPYKTVGYTDIPTDNYKILEV